MSKILVTGGLGFIGSNLINLLLKKKYTVLNIDKVSYASNFYNTREFKDNRNLFVFHAGTKIDGENILSNGGRVLNIVGKGKKFNEIRKKIIKLIKRINWKEGFYRRDIGWRVIEKL